MLTSNNHAARRNLIISLHVCHRPLLTQVKFKSVGTFIAVCVTMNQRLSLAFLKRAFILCAVVFRCTVASTTTKPNVLFIVVDDLGWDDVGFRSGDINTPTIDALAAKGRVLDQYYVQSVCSPSRATFMTGRYAMHNTIVDWIPPASPYGLPLNETTMAEKFKEAGYATAMSGKWHLGFYKWQMTPTFRGFDSFKGFYSGGEDYFTHVNAGAYDFRRDRRPNCGKGCSEINWEDEGLYSTTVFTKEAERVVYTHNTSKPLFLYLAFQGVHAPAEVPASYVKPYESTIKDPKRRQFAGMLSCVDEGIANVTKALDARGMLNTTLIVFTSDNGGPVLGGDAVGSRNWPLRGGKHSVWEGGVRAVAFVTGFGIQPSVVGRSYDNLMHGVDWLPTMSAVAGYPLTGTLPLDGVSQWDSIHQGGTAVRTDIVLGNSTNLCSWKVGDPRRKRYENDENISKSLTPCGFSIRDGHWKLFQGYGGAPDTWCNTTEKGDAVHCRKSPLPAGHCPGGYCLYNVMNDPFELSESSAGNQQILSLMKNKLTEVLASYNQYELDKKCLTPKYAYDDHVGKTWEPWCE